VLMRAFCGAFHLSMLPKDLWVDGLIVKCTIFRMVGPSSTDACAVCPTKLEAFSFRQLFELAVRSYGASCTFAFERTIQSIMKREGGRNFLRQPCRFLTLLRYRKKEVSDFGVCCVSGGNEMFDLIRRMMQIGCDPAQVCPKELLKSLFVPRFHPILYKKPASENFIMENFFRTLVDLRFPICCADCVIIPHGMFYGMDRNASDGSVHAAIRRTLYGEDSTNS